MAKKLVAFTIEESIWIRFCVYCTQRKKKYSHVLKELIENLLKRSQ